MKIHRLYADKNGESHFQDVEIEFAETTRAGRLSKRMPATGIIFREVQPDYDLDWHPAPRRQYIINLDAGVQITASDGESRRIGAGCQSRTRTARDISRRRSTASCAIASSSRSSNALNRSLTSRARGRVSARLLLATVRRAPTCHAISRTRAMMALGAGGATSSKCSCDFQIL